MQTDDAKLNMPATVRDVAITSTLGRIVAIASLRAIQALVEGDKDEANRWIAEANAADDRLAEILTRMTGTVQDAT